MRYTKNGAMNADTELPDDIEFLGPFENLFKFIKWEDEEPTLIKDALDKVEY